VLGGRRFDAAVGADEIASGIEAGTRRLVNITRACRRSGRLADPLLLLSS
jgi:hypothetical protein